MKQFNKDFSKVAIAIVLVTYPIFIIAAYLKGDLTVLKFILTFLLAAGVCLLISFVNKFNFVINRNNRSNNDQ